MKKILPFRIFIGLIIACLCARLSYWQWNRHLEKVAIIKGLNDRLKLPIVPLTDILNKPPKEISYLRSSLEGEYDFDHEVLLKNRRHNENPGSIVITPMKLKDSATYILVARGFIPFLKTSKEDRKKYRDSPTSFVGLVKESVKPEFLATSDPETGKDLPWVDEWLRVDIEKIKKQLPYEVLPFYVEIMGTTDAETASKEIIVSNSGRDDMMNMASKGHIPTGSGIDESAHYPIPMFDLVIPAGRHLGYVFEWLFIGALGLVISILVENRARQRERITQSQPPAQALHREDMHIKDL